MGMGFTANSAPTTKKNARMMTLADFMKDAGEGKININDIFRNVNTGSYSACHVAFYEATGIWIPELQEVFQKMDAMAVMGDKIEPQELR